MSKWQMDDDEQILTTHGLLTIGQLRKINERKPEEETKVKEQKPKRCPFNGARCGASCALYSDGCTIISERDPVIIAEYRICPFSRDRRTCSEECALRNDGYCRLITRK